MSEEKKNIVAEETATDEQETESTEVQATEEPKVSKLLVAKVFLKNNWKKIAVGAAVVVAGALVLAARKTDDEPIEGEYNEIEDDGAEDSEVEL